VHHRRGRFSRCFGYAAVLLAAGCEQPGPAGVRPAVAEAVPASFAESFELQNSILLEQPDSAPIVRLSGIDRNPAGQIVIGDVSEGNVKLFAPDGSLIRVIGRKGRGPGEFTAPRYPRFGPGGRIYVADAQDPRIQVFDSVGDFLGGTRIQEVGVILGFFPLESGNYLVTVERERDPRVLVEVDSAGRTQREFLSIAGVNPTGQKDFELWRNVRSFSLAVSGDTAYVSSTLSDTVWSVHLPSGAETRTRLVFPGYAPPTPAARMPEGIPGLMAWSRSFHTSSTLSADARNLFLPFVQGVLNYGDPMLLLMRSAGGWRVISDAPPVIGAGGGAAIGLLGPGEEEVRLGFFVPRARQ
jgi:hypothetical protein